MRLIGIALLGLASAASQSPSTPQTQQEAAANTQPQTLQTPQSQEPGNWVTVPAGTKVMLVLKNSISSKNAKKGDGVYLESSFPITQDGRVVIPAGTFVQGVIDEVKRPGRVKGRGEILMHFTSLVYPNGYTVNLPSSGVESTDSNDSQTVDDKEGTVKAGGTKGRDAGTVAATTATGAGIGAATGGWKGLGVGSGIGAAAGLGTVLLTRGEEVRLYQGTTIEMVLNRPLKLDTTRIDPTERLHFIPVREGLQQRQRLIVPTTVGDGPIVR
jgi:hypothetical protein